MAENPETDLLARAVSRLEALPCGCFIGTADRRRYIISKTTFSGGRSTKLVAEELGGTDYISLNVYHLACGPRLFPCEMSPAKVISFLCGLRVIGQDDA